MSDIHFFNNSDKSPKPKNEIEIKSVKATPYADRFRVHVEISVTPFQERPNLLLVMKNENGRIINELDVIATMHADMEFTIHMRNVDDPAGDYTLETELFYETRNPPQSKHTITFSIPEES